MVYAWDGTYPIDSTDPWFHALFRIADFADEHARGRAVDEATFRAALDALRPRASGGAAALLAEVEHRWEYPEAPRGLYVFTSEIHAWPGHRLVADGRDIGLKAPLVTKYGCAKRTVARRVGDYDIRGIGRAEIPKGTVVLRALIYGRGRSMPSESRLARIARDNGTLLERIDEAGELRSVTSESYLGE